MKRLVSSVHHLCSYMRNGNYAYCELQSYTVMPGDCTKFIERLGVFICGRLYEGIWRTCV